MPERLTSVRFDEVYALPARAATTYFKGRLLASDASGRAAAAADAPGLIVVGMCDASQDNLAGAHGAKLVSYRTGCFLFENDAAHPLLQSHVNKPCFVKDDITVSASPGEHNVFAGFFRGYHNNGDGVWVDTKFMGTVAHFFGNNPDSNFRFSSGEDGAPIFQLWNQDQDAWQTVQLAGAAGAERLIIAAAAA